MYTGSCSAHEHNKPAIVTGIGQHLQYVDNITIPPLILVSFDTYSLGKTVRYLSIFNVFYLNIYS